VEPIWRTVSVAASCCVDANIASTAAIVHGDRAPGWLSDLKLPARLVAVTGEAHAVAGWPVLSRAPRV
jgi:FAD:protein FMN transferase